MFYCLPLSMVLKDKSTFSVSKEAAVGILPSEIRKGGSPGHMEGMLRSSGPDLFWSICVNLSS